MPHEIGDAPAPSRHFAIEAHAERGHRRQKKMDGLE